MPGRFAFWVALLGAAFHLSAQSPAEGACAQTPALSRTVAEISGMALKHTVPCEYITQDKVSDFLKKRIKDAAKPEQIRAEELVLKRFGFVPSEFDLEKTTVDLLTEQAAAFYDYDRKRLFITGTTPSSMQTAVLVHELAHAVADQTFDLGKFIRKGREADDGSTARLAVMEGQATWIMTEYMARQLGHSLRKSPELALLMNMMSEDAGGQFPVFDKAPLYFRLSLIFPYTRGVIFQNDLVRRFGDGGFSQPFRRAPVSTQQILHADKYFENLQPTRPALPKVNLPGGYKGLVEGVLGEFDHSVLIQQYAGKELAAEISSHWRGSAFEIRENRQAGRAVLLYSVEWDNEEAARRYFDIYRDVLKKKSKTIEFRVEQAGLAKGITDQGAFELRQSGAVVSSVEGLDPELN